LSAFIEWVSAQPEIQTAMMVGSYARNESAAASDIDLVIVTTARATFLRNQEWVERFGKVDRQQVEDYGKVCSLRVWYVGGPEVEFGFTDATWLASPLDEGTQKVISGGMRVLFQRG
jgi:predicted nucleotidyltransferase